MKVAPALAAGNTIIIKPSVETPLSAVAFGKLCTLAGIPPGVVNIALGSGSTTGNHLVKHPEVKKISFTGSTAIGKAIQVQATEYMKAVNLELGGKNAIIVFEDANLQKAADAVLYSAFANTGQLCVSCSRLLVQDTVQEEFENILLDKLQKIHIGDPEERSTQIGPMITKSQFETVLEYIHIASVEGCRVIAGGNAKVMPQKFKSGYWLEPTIVSGVSPEMRVAQEEVFGPLLSIIAFNTEAEAVEISNSVIYGLSGSVWTSDGARSMRIVKALKTGIIWVNTMLTGYPQIPVPPQKMSGTGVELGLEGMMAYSRQKSAIMSYDLNAPVGWDTD
jgi:acyl-CoA reductase-like NAD-dependent aldehyde dehydrogenase